MPIAIAAMSAPAAVAYAQAGIPAGAWASGRAPGVVAGLLLAGLVAYALFLCARPIIAARDRALPKALLLLAVVWIAKTFALLAFHGFQTDVGTYEAWALQIANAGPAHLYRPGYFIDYPPGYLYPLWLAGWFARTIGASGEALRIIVETPAMAADLLLALLVFVLVRARHPSLAWLAMLLVALNPALLFDTVVWGQTDSAVTFVMLLSVAMMVAAEFELGWACAALAVLIKPQALTLLPVLGLWTLLRSAPRRWWRAALALIVVVVVGVAPFQIGHAWDWLPALYQSTASYYHETSVNAFNFMALIGGVRQQDSGTILGVTYFIFGMALLVPLYGFLLWMLWRAPSKRNLLCTCFLALFGFFMFAPRMHERYLYPALAFVVPLALEEPAMMGVFVLLTCTCFINLAYVLHTLRTTVFMGARDSVAMMTAIANLFGFAIAAVYGYRAGATVSAPDPEEAWFGTIIRRVRTGFNWWPPAVTYERFPWLSADTLALTAIVAIAALLRFWHIGHPHEIVFDEVHFVGQARHYLRGEPFLDPHPPLDKLIIALGIMLFGDHSTSWRLGNALLGTVMAGVTYMLGRRMFRSRLAGVLAAAFIACDGFFIVDSRIGVIDIAYLTFAAIAYLFLFRFIQNAQPLDRRRTILCAGIALGLCLGSKLYVPGITFLLVFGFMAFTLWRSELGIAALSDSQRIRRLIGAALLIGSVSAFLYLAAFLPKYYLGWWGGMADLFHYYKQVIWYENSVAGATHPYSSPWWSWPLMLRPVAYWENFPKIGDVATIWGAGNPLTWWAVIPAITITAVRALERQKITRTFLVVGYLAYLVIWIPITRILFLYHYMPSVYIGYLALGGIMAEMWTGDAELWEALALMVPLLVVYVVGVGHIASTLAPGWLPARTAIFHVTINPRELAGIPLVAIVVFTYIALLHRPRAANRFLFVAFVVTAVALFLFYLPIWLGTPIPRIGYYARMWFEGPGLHNWI
ncbi:MAG: phospholipid carrier-dependent glycosyltransferase [Candidatus Binataceae bacterium]